MNVENLKELSRAVRAVAKHLATVIEHPIPDSLSDDAELESLLRQPSVRLARHIQLAYKKREAPLIDTILSINWQRGQEGVNAASTSTSSTDRNRSPVDEDSTIAKQLESAKFKLNVLIGFPERRPVYRTVPANGMLFTSTVHIDNGTLGSGSGKTKKAAERAAAADALNNPLVRKWVYNRRKKWELNDSYAV
jgi:hypothetical protein